MGDVEHTHILQKLKFGKNFTNSMEIEFGRISGIFTSSSYKAKISLGGNLDILFSMRQNTRVIPYIMMYFLFYNRLWILFFLRLCVTVLVNHYMHKSREKCGLYWTTWTPNEISEAKKCPNIMLGIEWEM